MLVEGTRKEHCTMGYLEKNTNVYFLTLSCNCYFWAFLFYALSTNPMSMDKTWIFISGMLLLDQSTKLQELKEI